MGHAGGHHKPAKHLFITQLIFALGNWLSVAVSILLVDLRCVSTRTRSAIAMAQQWASAHRYLLLLKYLDQAMN
jgi:hypothetical protein